MFSELALEKVITKVSLSRLNQIFADKFAGIKSVRET
jgi:hypothetical protein